MGKFTKMCLRCESGNHIGCLIPNCQCPVPNCVFSRYRFNEVLAKKVEEIADKLMGKEEKKTDG